MPPARCRAAPDHRLAVLAQPGSGGGTGFPAASPTWPSCAGRTSGRVMAGWKAPFFMGPYNTRVVRRSNALSGYAYGKHFRYREVMNVGSSFRVPRAGRSRGRGHGCVGSAIAVPADPLCSIVCCPSRERDRARRRGAAATSRSTCTATRRAAPYTSRIAAQGDPGYAATAVIVRRVGAGVGGCSATSYPIVPASSPRDRDGRRAGRRLRAAGFEIRAEPA